MSLLLCLFLLTLAMMGCLGTAVLALLKHTLSVKTVALLLSVSGLCLAFSVLMLFVGVMEEFDKHKKERNGNFAGEPFRVGDHPPFRTGSSMRRQS